MQTKVSRFKRKKGIEICFALGEKLQRRSERGRALLENVASTAELQHVSAQLLMLRNISKSTRLRSRCSQLGFFRHITKSAFPAVDWEVKKIIVSITEQ